MSICGIGFIALAIIVDFLSISLTEISSIGFSIKMKREYKLNTFLGILLVCLSFIYCVDIVMVITYYLYAKKHINYNYNTNQNNFNL